MFFNNLKNGLLIIPIHVCVFNLLNKLPLKRTNVPIGSFTDTHSHIFFSMYITDQMQAIKNKREKLIQLPKRALTIVLPFSNHTWINLNGYSNNSLVYDISPGHRKHVIFE